MKSQSYSDGTVREILLVLLQTRIRWIEYVKTTPKNIPTNIDMIQSDIHTPGSACSKSTTRYVNSNDDLSGNKNTHNASSGKLSNNGENAVNTKGAEKAHKNPASKPDQICRLPKKFVNFLIAPFNR